MVHLPREAIESFRKAYKTDFGRDISDAEAKEYGRIVLDVLGVSLDIIVRAKQRKARFESSAVSEYRSGTDREDQDAGSLN